MYTLVKPTMRYLQLICVIFIVIFTAFLIYNLLSISSRFHPNLSLLYNQRHQLIVRRKDYLNATSGNNRYLAVKFIGRLGNCMFQYASTLGLAKLTGRQPVVFYEKNLMPIFPNLSVPIFADINHLAKVAQFSTWFDVKTIKENPFSSLKYSAQLIRDLKKDSETPVLIISGYFQSWKYFSSVHSQLTAHDFNFDLRIQNNVNETLRQLRKAHDLLVGIHIRREDYVSSEVYRKYGYIPAQESYIKRAIGYFQNKYPARTILYVIPSQEKKWCQQIFRNTNLSIYYTNFTVPAEDMYILTQTDHLITTVGTFGWWAGYLNKGTVIYQKHVAVKGSTFATVARYPEDFFPPRFITVNEP